MPAGRLVIESVGEPPEEVSLDQSSIVVGRDRLCDVCISGLKASRFHALFSLTTHGLVVADLASTNGTTVNGNRIDRYTLESEDVVLVGDTRITYYAGGEQLMKAAEPRPNGARSGFDHAPEPSINFVGNGLHLLKTS